MKQTENSEMDLLLRGLARRKGTRAVAPEDQSAKHLDADELNSYAEQVLPAAARARYTTHLADCESCRKIVSELTSASGIKVGEHSVAPEASGLRQMLAALFSPRVLRYAMPALALSAFFAVGLIAFRQQTEPEVALNSEVSTAAPSAIATKQADSVNEQEVSPANDARGFHDSSTLADKGKDNFAKSGETNSSVATSTDSVSAGDDRDASPAKAAGAVAQPSYAPEPAAPPPPKPQAEVAESRTEVTARPKKEADKNEDEAMRGQEGARARTDDRQNQVARPQAAREAPAVQDEEKRRAPEVAKLGGGLVGPKAKKDVAETRTVSGRRFRLQGGIWVDTAFQSSTATTILSRGSEQFRALVADEPGIREIAAQLSGEVVVVWKGRAYRIR